MTTKPGKLTANELAIACEVYAAIGVPLDKLAFSDEFDRLHATLQSRIMRPIARMELWRELSNARKAKNLPAITRKPNTETDHP